MPFHTHTHTCTCARITITPAKHAPTHLTPVSHFLDTLAYTHSVYKRQQLHTQTDRPTEGRTRPVKGPGRAVAKPGRLPWVPPHLQPAQALYLALRCCLQLFGWLLPIDLPGMGHWSLGPGGTWGRESMVGQWLPVGHLPARPAVLSLLLPEEPSGGLTGLSPGLESETDFWESTVARSCNPDRLAGQCCSRHRPSRSCHQPTYLDPFRACVQGVAPAAPATATGHAAQAATAVPACQQEGAASASASPAEPRCCLAEVPPPPPSRGPHLPANGFLSTQISSGGAEGPAELHPWGGLGSAPAREPAGQAQSP